MQIRKKVQMRTDNEGLSFRLRPIIIDKGVKLFRASDFQFSKSTAETFKETETIDILMKKGKLFHGSCRRKCGVLQFRPLLNTFPKKISRMLESDSFLDQIRITIDKKSFRKALADANSDKTRQNGGRKK